MVGRLSIDSARGLFVVSSKWSRHGLLIGSAAAYKTSSPF
jgi:hypothetical protein